MGNSQSSPCEALPQPNDYYALLEVGEEATADELRRSYRRLALKHHPDKNPGCEAEATKAFALIQQAYQVLCDPQERAWYNRNRVRFNAKQERRAKGRSWQADDLMVFFSTPFYEDNGGFYAVYGRVFAHIAALEPERANFDWQSDFGGEATPFEPKLRAFYDQWLSFSSNRTDFAVPHDAYFDSSSLGNGYNRRDRRHLEKERDKQVEQAKRDYSDAVRNLASFVRKRDGRYKAFLESKKRAADAAERAKQDRARQDRANSRATYHEPEWARLDADEEALLAQLHKLDLSSSEGEGEDEGEAELYCVACRKTFKSQKQWKNHEQSRRHLTELAKFATEGPADADADTGADTGANASASDVSSDRESAGGVATDDGPGSFEMEDPAIRDREALAEEQPATSYEETKQKPPRRKERSAPAKKAPAAAAKKTKEKRPKVDPELTCAKCRQAFASRNGLFGHLKESGHSKPLPE